jgi:hypothetical protein
MDLHCLAAATVRIEVQRRQRGGRFARMVENGRRYYIFLTASAVW